MSRVEIEKLNQHPDMIATVATSWFNQWSYLNSDFGTVEAATQALHDKSLGWQPVSQLLDRGGEVLLMKKQIGSLME